ncbi:Cyclin-B2-2 [Hordeum vulgare]|uniref:uncharacterized protein LOC123412565 n=1 Tax=Hordeum vulgare subsp. vulgare TaxID=112509 RepID=UPI00162C7B16|nr:uncharacterized protein LOC123412565 [Hordeum vulgare subsp. vulgare]KAE8772190.1 Cyclin-B2-2 [Hordeum vulgare]
MARHRGCMGTARSTANTARQREIQGRHRPIRRLGEALDVWRLYVLLSGLDLLPAVPPTRITKHPNGVHVFPAHVCRKFAAILQQSQPAKAPLERMIVKRLEFNMSVPNPYCFMRRFLKGNRV